MPVDPNAKTEENEPVRLPAPAPARRPLGWVVLAGVVVALVVLALLAGR